MICTPHPILCGCIKSRRMRWAGHVARMGEEMGVYRVLVVKPEGRRPLGRPRRNVLILLARCQQTCMYCCVYSEKLLMMDRGTVRNM